MAKSILIVEDQRLLARTLSSALREAGYEASTVRSAEQAEKRIFSGSGFDLVILDNRLPKADGLSVLQELRKREAETKVILMTAYDSSGVREKAHSLGVDGYVKKPFDLGWMLSYVQELLSEDCVEDEQAKALTPQGRG
ncbi:MAG: response regulator [Candidatus Eiseniibacteriota bacterium]|nr:MAG: response regulator [Candidatus Eisenbacteria bacterium]